LRGTKIIKILQKIPKTEEYVAFTQKQIKKILEVDYPRGRAKGYYANFISAKTAENRIFFISPLCQP
jgi:hypothetical protein